MTNIAKPTSRIKPTLETKFHIDYSWWKREDRDLRAYLVSHLLPEQREQFEGRQGEDDMVDFVDPDTAEVRRVDALQRALAKAAKDPQYITEHTTLVDAVFRVFLANANRPLSPVELNEQINRNPNTILKTLSGTTVYKGLRPVTE